MRTKNEKKKKLLPFLLIIFFCCSLIFSFYTAAKAQNDSYESDAPVKLAVTYYDAQGNECPECGPTNNETSTQPTWKPTGESATENVPFMETSPTSPTPTPSTTSPSTTSPTSPTPSTTSPTPTPSTTLISGKVCSEDKGMTAGRCYVGSSCYGVGPGLALGVKGEMGCPSDQICCKTQEYQDATQGKPETGSTNSTSPTSPSASSPAPVRDPGGLVPCDQNCTLCHIVIGFKKIFDWLMGLLFITTMLVITISGVFYMVSTGSKAMMDKAKKALTYALTAFVIGMGCWLMINIIMTMLGFQNPVGGNWWEFTCDTTQTQGATPNYISSGSGGGGTASDKGGGISGKGRDIQVPQDGSKLAQNLEKYKGTVYDFGANRFNGDGTMVTDCSGFTQKIWKDTYGVDIPRHSGDQGNTAFNASSLVNGTILESNGHVGVFYNGSVYHNSTTGADVKVVELNRYLSNHNVREMRLPPA